MRGHCLGERTLLDWSVKALTLELNLDLPFPLGCSPYSGVQIAFGSSLSQVMGFAAVERTHE